MVKIPVAFKLNPSSAPSQRGSQLDGLGADALVSSTLYQPDVDVATQQIRPVLTLSRPEDILLPLRWIAILHGQWMLVGPDRRRAFADDALKAILVGASVAQYAGAAQGRVGKLERDRARWARMDELDSSRGCHSRRLSLKS